MADQFAKRLDKERQQRLDKEFLKSKPKAVSSGEYLMRGSTAKWSRGKYRKQAEAQEAKEHKTYRKDNPKVKAGNAPIEGTKEEYVRRSQVQHKIDAYNARTKRANNKKKTTKRVVVK